MNSIIVEEHIPAFSMWKMLNETVPVLRKNDCSEASIKKLTSIIQSKEGSNIFISHKDPSVSFEQFQEINNCYKVFTTWILGQFLYLLSLEKLENLHEIIIDAQLSILDQLSKTQVHIYCELSHQYSRAFLQLVEYYNSNTQNTLFRLTIFVPENHKDLEEKLNLQQVYVEISSKSQCKNLLEKLTRFINYILKENFIYYSFEDDTYEVLDSLLLLIHQSNDSLRIKVIEIFIEILNKSRTEFYIYNSNIQTRILLFSNLFEQYVYKIYDSQITLNGSNLQQFEYLVMAYLKLERKWEKCIKNFQKIQQYTFQRQFDSKCKIKPCDKILNIIQTIEIERSFKIDPGDITQSTLFYGFKMTIYNEIFNYEVKTSELKAFSPDISWTYSKIYNKLVNRFTQIECQDGTCAINEFLKYFKNISNMLIELKIELFKHKDVFKNIQFFDEIELIHIFLSKISSKNTCNHSNVTIEELLDYFMAFILVTNSRNILCIFEFIMQPLMNALNIKSDNVTNDFIGGDWELKKLNNTFHKYLLCKNVSKHLLLKYVNHFLSIMAMGFIDFPNSQMKNVVILYIKVCETILENGDPPLVHLVSIVLFSTNGEE